MNKGLLWLLALSVLVSMTSCFSLLGALAGGSSDESSQSGNTAQTAGEVTPVETGRKKMEITYTEVALADLEKITVESQPGQGFIVKAYLSCIVYRDPAILSLYSAPHFSYSDNKPLYIVEGSCFSEEFDKEINILTFPSYLFSTREYTLYLSNQGDKIIRVVR